MLQFRRDDFDDLKAPLYWQGRGKYSIFKCLKDRIGVYVFHDRETCTALYVGSGIGSRSGNGLRDIRHRLKQHYVWSKTAATFYNNWCEFHGHCPSEERLPAFLDYFCQWKLTTLTISGQRHQKLVEKLENELTRILRPKYKKGFFPNQPGVIGEIPTSFRSCAGHLAIEVR